jgi:hypothetical protein
MSGPGFPSCPLCDARYGTPAAVGSNLRVVTCWTERSREYRVMECRCGHFTFVDWASSPAGESRQEIPFAR